MVMFTSGLALPLLLLLTTSSSLTVVGLQTVSLDNIAFRQEASQSLTLGQYKPGSLAYLYLYLPPSISLFPQMAILGPF